MLVYNDQDGLAKTGRQSIDKVLVERSFRKGGATYEQHAVVQKEIGKDLVCRLSQEKNVFDRVLEIGCCTGYLTRQLCTRCEITTLFANDIVEDFCLKTSKRMADTRTTIVPLAGDIEQLRLPQQLELVISSATFQWLEDFATLVRRVWDSLKPGGIFAFSIFTEGTMEELLAITGRGLGYQRQEQLQEMLSRHFTIVYSKNEGHQLYFTNLRAILKHIVDTGVGGVSGKKHSLGDLRRFEKEYRMRFLTPRGLSLSYCSSHFILRKDRG